MQKLEIKSPRVSFAGRIAVMTALALPACADTSALDALIASQQNAADGSVDRADAVINGDVGDAGRMDNDADSAVAPVDTGPMNDVQDAGIPEDVQVLPDVQTVDMPMVMVDSGMGTDVVDAGMRVDTGTDVGTDSGTPVVDVPTDTGSGCTLTSLVVNQGRPVNLNGTLSAVPVRVILAGSGCADLNGANLPVQLATVAATGSDAGVQTPIEDNDGMLAMGAVNMGTTEINTQLNLARFNNLDGRTVRVNVLRGGNLAATATTNVFTFAPSVTFRAVYGVPSIGTGNLDVTSNLPSSVSMDCSIRFLASSGSSPWFVQGNEAACSSYMASCEDLVNGSNNYMQTCGSAMNSALSIPRYSCLMNQFNTRVVGGNSTINYMILTGNPALRPTPGSTGRVRVDCIDPRSSNTASRSAAISAD